MNVHWLQHVPFEGLGCIESWLNDRGHTVTTTRLHENDLLPNLRTIDWLIVMGGPMGVDDEAEHPWLAEETEYVQDAIRREKTILGICLGAQLISKALGARVFRNPYREIGWFPITVTESGKTTPLLAGFTGTLMALHWHSDTFHIPDGALHTVESSACRNQSFVYGDRVLALQFHLDLTRAGLERLINNCGDELDDSRYVQRPEQLLAPVRRFDALNAKMIRILENMEAVGTGAAEPGAT